MLQYRVPVYQIAAGILLVLGIRFGWLTFHHPTRTTEEKVIKVVTGGVPITHDRYPEALVFEL